MLFEKVNFLYATSLTGNPISKLTKPEIQLKNEPTKNESTRKQKLPKYSK